MPSNQTFFVLIFGGVDVSFGVITGDMKFSNVTASAFAAASRFLCAARARRKRSELARVLLGVKGGVSRSRLTLSSDRRRKGGARRKGELGAGER